MEIKNAKCSSSKHGEINAVSYCLECKKYLCNKCLTFHEEMFGEHKTINLKEKDEIFIDKCKEENHICKLEYFCKDHNNLCCALCLCNVTSIKKIENEKRNKLKENINNLKELYNQIDQSINK